MKYLNFLVVLPLIIGLKEGKTQCIEDVRYLIDSPEPCFFIGMVDMANTDCFDPLNPDWTYTWTIKNAESGETVAEYDGYAFSHSIELFGGYEFCLSVDKDGNNLTPPEVVNCVTYTTCEPCLQGTTDYEYVDCGSPSGCKLKLSGTLPAINAHGIKEFAKLVVTYVPTPQEVQVGLESYDLVFNSIPVTFHPADSTITIEEEVTVPYTRGCYEYKFVLDLEYGAGAHSEYGGPGCDELTIYGDKMLKCMACDYNSLTPCMINQAATDLTNETGICDALGCVFGLGERNAAPETIATLPSAFNAYPNPANDHLIVELPGDANDTYTLRLINTMGQTVIQHTSWGGTKENLSLTKVPTGVYMLLVSDGTMTHFKEKILVSQR